MVIGVGYSENKKVPAVFGVPDIVAFWLLNVKPPGKVPEDIEITELPRAKYPISIFMGIPTRPLRIASDSGLLKYGSLGGKITN